ncbi:signal peptidase I [Butyrivibrio sp. X503]|uniref:signal peptidase I n=1 Tax=Butyrivibrio sp. X503 TaxID=2364878 RepID=UPI000EA9715B|nr:signal peptidase I [Butyrivibrio sp. X503]RKM58221.1 signal peptidase I [Butyrivibrio sp. X503]
MKKQIIKMVCIIFVLILLFSFDVKQIAGNSMFPTLKAGSFVVGINRRYVQIKKDNVIIFEKGGQILIKRIVAEKGDIISSKNDSLCINGNIIKGCYYANSKAVILAENEYFVVGDNYDVSVDSRTFGVIKRAQIKSAVIL